MELWNNPRKLQRCIRKLQRCCSTRPWNTPFYMEQPPPHERERASAAQQQEREREREVCMSD